MHYNKEISITIDLLLFLYFITLVNIQIFVGPIGGALVWLCQTLVQLQVVLSRQELYSHRIDKNMPSEDIYHLFTLTVCFIVQPLWYVDTQTGLAQDITAFIKNH